RRKEATAALGQGAGDAPARGRGYGGGRRGGWRRGDLLCRCGRPGLVSEGDSVGCRRLLDRVPQGAAGPFPSTVRNERTGHDWSACVLAQGRARGVTTGATSVSRSRGTLTPSSRCARLRAAR